MTLGADGVLRSVTAKREVIDAVGLLPRLIKAEPDQDEYDEQREKLFRGVDGTQVPRKQWFKPPADLLMPPPLSEAQVEEGKAQLRKLGVGDQVQAGGRVSHSCPVEVKADHKIEAGAD